MAYKYLDHEADVGILASGKSLEECFCEGARAAFNVMADINKVRAQKKIMVKCESETLSSLFVEWVNELISLADKEDMFFSGFNIIKINKSGEVFKLEGEASGETRNAKEHNIKTEVKAATYSGLKYEIKGKTHYVQCVLDV